MQLVNGVKSSVFIFLFLCDQIGMGFDHIVMDIYIWYHMDPKIVRKRLEWMQCPNTLSDLFQNGVNEFLEFAFSYTYELEVPCPSRKCNNNEHKKSEEIKNDLL